MKKSDLVIRFKTILQDLKLRGELNISEDSMVDLLVHTYITANNAAVDACAESVITKLTSTSIIIDKQSILKNKIDL